MMASLFLWDSILLVSVFSIAFLAGWFIHEFEVRRRSRQSRESRRLARDVLDNLHSLIDDVSADMDQHSDCLSRVNEELAVAVTGDTKLVAAALSRLLTANGDIRRRLESAELLLQEQSRTIKTHAVEARTDSLTQLVNRRAFDDEMNRCFSAYRRQRRMFSIAILDIDHFKGWNDAFGHPSGDRVLSQVAAILMHQVREMDLVARYGGEEFAVIFPGTSLADATRVAERVRLAVAHADFILGSEKHAITVSAGTAEVRPEDTITTLIGRADAALYESKTAGRNCVHFDDGHAMRPADAILDFHGVSANSVYTIVDDDGRLPPLADTAESDIYQLAGQTCAAEK
ncbi:MAG: GGDEF domain-containing protein [Pirellulaceae bacterium]|nr:GGDEF domain-containing protein [Pirellulaceae bacterium]